MATAQCPVCKTERPLKKDGTFRKHVIYPARWTWAVKDCPGSGKPPKPEPAAE